MEHELGDIRKTKNELENDQQKQDLIILDLKSDNKLKDKTINDFYINRKDRLTQLENENYFLTNALKGSDAR